MSRSPLAYPLNRGADADAGGAADLQTDIMRFMAILSMCLLAIFALVQSIPLAPVEQTQQTPEPVPVSTPQRPVQSAPTPAATRAVEMQRQAEVDSPDVAQADVAQDKVEQAEVAQTPAPVTDPPEEAGFTLRFASDAALMRAVAAKQVGLYAIEQGRARRMTVSESRISFWDASTPNTFHEMEAGTVPLAVIEALGRTGADTASVSWGVTLPGKMRARLDSLLHAHRGGTLIIGADGNIHWEAP